MEAISILGKNVMQPRGLVGLGYDSIDNCGPEIAEVRIHLLPISFILSNKYQGSPSILLHLKFWNLSSLHSGKR